MTRFEELLKSLVRHEVQFVIVGGIAATVHGSARTTTDLDIVYSRDRANLERLVTALTPLNPYLRDAPAGLPFRWDLATLRNGLNFTLITTLGDLDLLGEVAGGGSYKDLASHSNQVEIFGSKCLCIDLEHLIKLKLAAGRNKDLQVVSELRALAEERAKKKG